jgi:K+-transporting ATPase KdpF subunit
VSGHVGADSIMGLIASILLLGYLVVALLRPEKF